MKRLIRRLLPLTLCALLMLSGCSPAAQPSGAEPGANRGRYIEQNLSLPDDLATFMAFEQLEDGTLMLLGFQANDYVGSRGAKGDYKIWSSSDGGESWNEEAFPWLQELLDMGNVITAASFVTADEVYVYTTHYPEYAVEGEDEEEPTEPEEASGEEDGAPAEPQEEGDAEEEEAGDGGDEAATPPSFNLYRGGRDGCELLTDGLLAEFEAAGPTSIAYQDGRLLFNAYETSRLMDLESLSFRQDFVLHNDARYGNYYLDGDTFAIVQPSGIQLYGLSTGKLESELPYTTGNTQEEGYSTLPNDLTAIAPLEGQEGIYYCNSTGIYRILGDGSATERLLDGELCSLGLPTEYLLHFIPRQDGSFVTLFTNSEYTFKLRRYVFDVDVASVPDIEITLYSLEDNATVRQAIGQFHSAHPEARINYQVGLADDGVVSAAEALRSLSTQLLAGAGPDVIVLDDMPIDSYIEKGVLEDLSPLVDQKIQSGELLGNIANTFRDENALYAVPARFAVPMLHGEGVAGIDSLASLADWMDGQEFGSGSPYNVVMQRFYPVAARSWYGADGAFDSEAFAADLVNIQRIADPYEDLEGRPWSEKQRLIGGALEMKASRNSLNFGYAYDLTDIAGPLSLIEETGAGELVLFPDGGGYYVPGTILGVNAASDNIGLAKDFVEMVLSKDNMLHSFSEGIPVNGAALDEIAENKGGDSSGSWGFGDTDPDTGEYTLFLLNVDVPPTEELRAFIQELEQLDAPCHANAVVRQLVIDETMPYLAGDKSLEDTVQAVTSKLDLYLAEIAVD